MEQVQQVLVDRFGVEQFGTAVEVFGKLRRIMGVAALSGGREITHLHVFKHALTKQCHE